MTHSRFPRALAVLLLAASSLAACGQGDRHVTRRVIAAAATPAPRSGSNEVPIPVAGSFPLPGRPWYLTVGDSITSGFTRDTSRAGHNQSWAVQLAPLLGASGRNWALYDTACPGETTASYFTICPQHAKVSALPYMSQYDLDLKAIAAAPADLRLIIIDLGSNDLLHAAYAHDESQAVIDGLLGRVEAVVTKLRAAAPGVPVVLANFYDPFENLGLGELPALLTVNRGLAAIAARQGAVIADFFAAINTARPPAPLLCSLIDCPDSDIHPTVAGHAALARAALSAVVRADPAHPGS